LVRRFSVFENAQRKLWAFFMSLRRSLDRPQHRILRGHAEADQEAPGYELLRGSSGNDAERLGGLPIAAGEVREHLGIAVFRHRLLAERSDG